MKDTLPETQYRTPLAIANTGKENMPIKIAHKMFAKLDTRLPNINQETRPRWEVNGSAPYIKYHIYLAGFSTLHPQALGSFFVASYDLQDYGGGIRTRLHTGDPLDIFQMCTYYIPLILSSVPEVKLWLDEQRSWMLTNRERPRG
jgi:hypothetical protein